MDGKGEDDTSSFVAMWQAATYLGCRDWIGKARQIQVSKSLCFFQAFHLTFLMNVWCCCEPPGRPGCVPPTPTSNHLCAHNRTRVIRIAYFETSHNSNKAATMFVCPKNPAQFAKLQSLKKTDSNWAEMTVSHHCVMNRALPWIPLSFMWHIHLSFEFHTPICFFSFQNICENGCFLTNTHSTLNRLVTLHPNKYTDQNSRQKEKKTNKLNFMFEILNCPSRALIIRINCVCIKRDRPLIILTLFEFCW